MLQGGHVPEWRSMVRVRQLCDGPTVEVIKVLAEAGMSSHWPVATKLKEDPNGVRKATYGGAQAVVSPDGEQDKSVT